MGFSWKFAIPLFFIGAVALAAGYATTTFKSDVFFNSGIYQIASGQTSTANSQLAITATDVKGKQTADTQPRVWFDFSNGRIYLGPGGSTTPTGYLSSSDGANWTMTNGALISDRYADANITHAQLLALNSSPIEVIATPGAGKAIQVLSMLGSYVYGNIAAYTHAGSLVAVPTGNTSLTQAAIATGMITQTSNQMRAAGAVTTATLKENVGISLFAGSANPSGGDASNVVKFRIYYRIVNFPLP